MAQIKLLKIDDTNGVPLEFDSANDEITLKSFTVDGGAQFLDVTGLTLGNTPVSDVSNIVFDSPAVGTINQTAGDLIVDNIMAKERENLMTTAGSVSFPVISDAVGEVDAFRLPQLAGKPTAAPANGGEGHLVWDSSGNQMYAWDGANWVFPQQSVANVTNVYTAEEAIASRDVVYISSANSVSKALGDNSSKSFAIGIAQVGALITASCPIRSEGIITGFSGLTPGARYYLDAASAGAISASVPTGSGNTIVQVGYAKSATALHLQLAQLGRRAA